MDFNKLKDDSYGLISCNKRVEKDVEQKNGKRVVEPKNGHSQIRKEKQGIYGAYFDGWCCVGVYWAQNILFSCLWVL